MIEIKPMVDSRILEISIFNKRQLMLPSNENRVRVLTISEKPFFWIDDCDEICRIKFQNDESLKYLISELQNLLTL